MFRAIGYLGVFLLLVALGGCGIPCWGPLPRDRVIGVIVKDGIDPLVVKEGMDLWNAAVGTQFVLGADADYTVTVRRLANPELHPDILGLASLYDSMEVLVEPENGLPTYQTITHELGHLLGLDHVVPTPDSPCNIMNPKHCGAPDLTTLDLNDYYDVTYYCGIRDSE